MTEHITSLSRQQDPIVKGLEAFAADPRVPVVLGAAALDLADLREATFGLQERVVAQLGAIRARIHIPDMAAAQKADQVRRMETRFGKPKGPDSPTK